MPGKVELTSPRLTIGAGGIGRGIAAVLRCSLQYVCQPLHYAKASYAQVIITM